MLYSLLVVCLTGLRVNNMAAEKANIITWPVPWDVGAPMPFVISSRRQFLIYYASGVLASAESSTVKVVGEIDERNAVALVEFLGCLDLRFGGPDENAFAGGGSINGLTPHKAHVVKDSKWTEWLRRVSESSQGNDQVNWGHYKHFVLGFHDERFECIAKSFFIEVYSASFDDVAQIAFDRATGIDRMNMARETP
jgi:hypothetical protein